MGFSESKSFQPSLNYSWVMQDAAPDDTVNNFGSRLLYPDVNQAPDNSIRPLFCLRILGV